jgi:small subunit ribosomal protein S6
MRNYDIALVLDPALEEHGVEREIEKVRNFITSRGGQVLRVDKWGRKRLAYQLGRKRDGYYAFLAVGLESPAPLADFEHVMKLNEMVLRFRVLRGDPPPAPTPSAESAAVEPRPPAEAPKASTEAPEPLDQPSPGQTVS